MTLLGAVYLLAGETGQVHHKKCGQMRTWWSSVHVPPRDCLSKMSATPTLTETLLPRLRPVYVALIIALGLGLGLGLPSSDSTSTSPPPLPPWAPSGVPPSPPFAPPPSPSCGSAVDSLSAVIGWTYFAAWSVSFWPQIVMNWERHSVVGLSFDYILLNFCGFGCYAAYNIGLYYVPSIQQEYADAHGGNSSSVRANDVFFALQACAACAIGLLQIRFYERGRQRFSRTTLVTVVLFVAASTAGAIVIIAHPAHWCTWFNYLYALSFVKLAISIVKYVPQVCLAQQHRRRFALEPADPNVAGAAERAAAIDGRLEHRQRDARLWRRHPLRRAADARLRLLARLERCARSGGSDVCCYRQRHRYNCGRSQVG